MWEKLAEAIARRINTFMLDNEDPFNLEKVVKEEVQKFVRENVVMCYFLCDAETVKKAKKGK